MRSTIAPGNGLQLLKTPSYRQQAARRRIAVAAGVLALAVASGVIGALSTSGPAETGRQTGPFSYFPYQ